VPALLLETLLRGAATTTIWADGVLPGGRRHAKQATALLLAEDTWPGAAVWALYDRENRELSHLRAQISSCAVAKNVFYPLKN
jgi:hypothetical protein